VLRGSLDCLGSSRRAGKLAGGMMQMRIIRNNTPNLLRRKP
jgi:hypothetical protein